MNQPLQNDWQRLRRIHQLTRQHVAPELRKLAIAQYLDCQAEERRRRAWWQRVTNWALLIVAAVIFAGGGLVLYQCARVIMEVLGQ